MFRYPLVILGLLLSLAPKVLAADPLAVLEAVVTANQRVQPGLQNYLASVETSRIDAMMAELTKGIPKDVAPPPKPVVHKLWQRHGQSLVYASNTQSWPYVEKMVQKATSHLAVELHEMLLPPEQTDPRQDLLKSAELVLSEVALADNVLIYHLEIIFPEPTDLDQAFYVRGLRLPQKQVKKLVFDIDSRADTVNEMTIVTADGLQLTAEFRYIEVAGGMLPERIRVTSPDGKVDDLYEIEFTDVDGYTLPAAMTRTIRRPEFQDQFEVRFRDYRINQPLPDEVQRRLND